MLEEPELIMARTGWCVDLRYRAIDDVTAESLANALVENKNVSLLDLRDTALTPSGAQMIATALSGKETLEEVHLGYNKVGDLPTRGLLGSLNHCQRLHTLSLNGMGLTDAMGASLASFFSRHSNLIKVDLSCNTLQETTASYLSDALRSKGSKIEFLYLSYNKIGPKGAAEIATALSKNKALKVIYLRNNRLGDAGVASFFNNLLGNHTLSLVNVGDNEITDTGIELILEAAKKGDFVFSMLNLGRNSIGPKGAELLANFLSKNPHWTGINLGKNHLSDAGCRALCKALESNSFLKIFNVRDNKIGEAGGKAVAQMLRINSTIETLNLCDNQMGDLGTKTIAKAIARHPSLEKLYISDNAFTSKAFDTLEAAKETNKNLLIVHHFDPAALFGAPLGLDDYLAQPVVPQAVNLSNRNLGLQEIRAFIHWLEINGGERLKRLSLKGNHIGDEALNRLIPWLKKSNIAFLELSHNQIGPNGAIILASCLELIETLTFLDLRNNQVGQEGAKAVARAIGNKKALKFVDLSYNYVGFEFIEEICQYHLLDRSCWKF